jgi:hypothetical protein
MAAPNPLLAPVTKTTRGPEPLEMRPPSQQCAEVASRRALAVLGRSWLRSGAEPNPTPAVSVASKVIAAPPGRDRSAVSIGANRQRLAVQQRPVVDTRGGTSPLG